ncbi:hypothetical protein BJ170DRAFT_591543 [Xylariales sp. AK1849]|nr:hypothetical protein BJ170DRAFT_591543 [Xylariales sp. AK1849]
MAKFKAIIIGGGPAGLSMAHALRLAGIDYVLYEQRKAIADKSAAGFFVQPHVSRILHQFGLLEAAEKLAPVMYSTTHVMDGDKGWREDGVETLAKNYGYRPLLLQRYDFMKLLLDAIPDQKEHIRTGKTVESIIERDEGISIIFDDGTVDTGSLVIGADGVHSSVRRCMSEMSHGETDSNPFTSFYWGIYGHGPRPAGLRNGEIVERHDHGWAMQTLSGGDRTFFFLYSKLEEPTKERRRFTDHEAQKFVEPYLDKKIINNVTFGDLWEHREVGNMRYLEQGISKQWSHGGRIVLVGDAAHKVTPNLGVGGNMGIESAVCLANHLNVLLQTDPHPKSASLARSLVAYQKQRQNVVNSWYYLGYSQLQFFTWETKRHVEFFEKSIPSFGLERVAKHTFSDKYLQAVSGAVKLDYVPLHAELKGIIPWADEESKPEAGFRSKL